MTVRLINRELEVDLSYVKLSDAIHNLTRALEQVGDATLNIECYGSSCYGPDKKVYVSFKTEETKEERLARLEQENRSLSYRRKQFEEMKKEFGDV